MVLFAGHTQCIVPPPPLPPSRVRLPFPLFCTHSHPPQPFNFSYAITAYPGSGVNDTEPFPSGVSGVDLILANDKTQVIFFFI
jgi:hypothetical protein